MVKPRVAERRRCERREESRVVCIGETEAKKMSGDCEMSRRGSVRKVATTSGGGRSSLRGRDAGEEKPVTAAGRCLE